MELETHLDWADLRLFVEAHEHGSLTAAAEALGLGQATLSRRLAALERTVGHKLFVRSTRGLAPTAVGASLLPHATEMARRARDLQATLHELESEPEGWVRLAVPPGTATAVVAPMVPRFHARWPQIQLELRESTRMVDLDRAEADLAVRTRRPGRGDLVAQRLMAASVGLFASPDYVDRLPRDCTLRDLHFISWTAEFSQFGPVRWLVEHGLEHRVVMRSNGLLTQRAAAAAGVGAVLHESITATQGGLVPVLVEHPPLPVQETWLVTPESLVHVPRIAAVAEFIRDVVAFARSHGRLPGPEDRLDAARPFRAGRPSPVDPGV